MKVSTQRLPESQVVLEIEVEPEQMERSLDRAYRRLVQRVDVPGFRKGKTPRHMLERHLGRDRLVREAIELLIPEAYDKAIDDENIDPIDQPVIELVKDEPLSFKATVPVRPTVELGDYQSVRAVREPVTVETKEVDAAIEELRHRYAVHEPVERPVQSGDIVRADVRGVVEGREVYAEEDAEFHLREGAAVLLPGFAEGVIGAPKGVAKEFELTMPSGSQPLSDKTANFSVTVKEVKQERLPDANDDFAREVGEGFAGLQALRDQLGNNIKERLEAQAEEDYRDKAVTALVERTQKIEFPPVLVEREIDRLLKDQARSVGQDVERYLQMMRRTLEDLREEMRPAAVERVRRSLALTGLAEAEGIVVEPAEVTAEIERIVAASGGQAQQIGRLLSSPEGRDSIERSLLTRKTLDRLVEIAAQEATPKRRKRSTSAGTKEE